MLMVYKIFKHTKQYYISKKFSTKKLFTHALKCQHFKLCNKDGLSNPRENLFAEVSSRAISQAYQEVVQTLAKAPSQKEAEPLQKTTFLCRFNKRIIALATISHIGMIHSYIFRLLTMLASMEYLPYYALKLEHCV